MQHEDIINDPEERELQDLEKLLDASDGKPEVINQTRQKIKQLRENRLQMMKTHHSVTNQSLNDIVIFNFGGSLNDVSFLLSVFILFLFLSNLNPTRPSRSCTSFHLRSEDRRDVFTN